MKSFRWSFIVSLLLILPVVNVAHGDTYPLYLRYKPCKESSSLQEKIGSNLGLAPFKDERSDALYIGYYVSFFGSSSYFKSDPSPLERAIRESLLGPLFRYGIKTTPISDWDGKPESLKDLETDSVLMIQIKQFWIEGKVFSKNVEVSREVTLPRLTPEGMEKTLNEILTEIFDSFFSNPY